VEGTIRSRLAEVRARIARAASRAGRDPASIRLVAVSKTFPIDAVREAADAGQIDFGENRVQEALQKMDQTAGLPIRWHLIGHLQSNKAKKSGSRFDVVQSVDGADVMSLLNEGAASAGRQVQVLVQVDLAGEVTKFGAREDELPAIFAAAAIGNAARIAGLMTIPPAVADPDAARPYFRALRDVRDRLITAGVPASSLTELSMGMSHDFEVAIEEGATTVRVGSAIFGAR
jgi:pyridoxal phosphate enzyme (YggS family)